MLLFLHNEINIWTKHSCVQRIHSLTFHNYHLLFQGDNLAGKAVFHLYTQHLSTQVCVIVYLKSPFLRDMDDIPVSLIQYIPEEVQLTRWIPPPLSIPLPFFSLLQHLATSLAVYFPCSSHPSHAYEIQTLISSLSLPEITSFSQLYHLLGENSQT